MAKKRRKHSIIDKLNPELKATVEEMMKSDFTYQEIADYIKEQTEQPISVSSVCRYASNLNESVETLRMAQENFRVIMEEINKYPALDTSEGILTIKFLKTFKEKNDSYICRELLGCDLSTNAGKLYAREHDLFTEICPKMVVSATEIAEKLMIENE